MTFYRTVLSMALLSGTFLMTHPAHAEETMFPGLYTEGQIGLSVARDTDAKGTFTGGFIGTVPLDFGSSGVLSGSVGYTPIPNFRLETELAYRSPDADSKTGVITGLGTVTPLNNAIDLSATTLMVNGWYDIDIDGPVTPYVGGGVGVARLGVDTAPASLVQSSNHDMVFAYQVGAGAAYSIDKNVSLTGGYRYLDTANASFDARAFATDGKIESDYSAHELKIGVRYTF